MILFQTFQSFDLVGGVFVSMIFHSMIGGVILAFAVTSGVSPMCCNSAMMGLLSKVDAVSKYKKWCCMGDGGEGVCRAGQSFSFRHGTKTRCGCVG